MRQIDLLDGSLNICTETKDPEKSGLEAMEDRLYQTYKIKTSAVIGHLDEIGLPSSGAQFRLITRRRFNAVEMLKYIAERDPILDLKIAIYSINFIAARLLIELIDAGRIAHCDVLMSNLRNAAHREKEEIIKTMFLNHPNMSLFFCSSHAKVISCHTASGQYYTIEGSGNLAFNSRIEQYVIDNDPDLYQFTSCWMAEIRDYLATSGLNELQ